LSTTAGDEDVRAVVADAMACVAKTAGTSRAVQYEAYVVASVAKRVTVQPDGGRGLSMMNERALFVRTIKNGRMGISHTNDFRPKRVQECFRNASRLSSQCQKDVSLGGFPPAVGRYPRVEGLYDREVAKLELAGASRMVDEMLDAVLDSEGNVQVTGGQLWATHSVLGICNSSGIDVEQGSTSMEASCAALCGKGRSVSPECISTASSRRMDLPMAEIGRSCSFIAGRSCVQAPAKTGECEVVFSPRALGSMDSGLLTIMMARALSGMDVLNGSSVLADKLGEQVASDSLSIRDAPTLPGRSGSRPFDDEGVPTSDKCLVKRGFLESFVWDSHSGSQQGRVSTGNATRDMRSGLVTPTPLLLEVSRGGGNMHDLVAEVDNGYLIWDCQGAHTSSPETGAFSFVASPGLKIEGGDVVGGVQGAMLSGNIIDLLRGVGKIGSDHADFGCSLMPSILFNDVKITTG
jgi:PmbA protein